MPEKFYSDDELKEIAVEIIDSLRPKHLRVCDIRKIMRYGYELIECVVLREKVE